MHDVTNDLVRGESSVCDVDLFKGANIDHHERSMSYTAHSAWIQNIFELLEVRKSRQRVPPSGVVKFGGTLERVSNLPGHYFYDSPMVFRKSIDRSRVQGKNSNECVV